MPDLGRYGSREVLKLQVYDMGNNPIMNFDYANASTFDGSANRVYAWGSGNRRLAWDGEKEYTLTLETQIFSMQHLVLITGESIVKGAKDIYKVEDAVIETGGKITLSKTPIGTVSDVAVFKFNSGTIDNTATLEVDTIANKVITLESGAGFAVGDNVQVYYRHNVASANTISYTANGFPKYVKLAGDTIYVDEVSNEAIAQQLIFHKAKLKPEFSIAMSSQGDPASLSLTFDLFPVNVNGTQTIADHIMYDDEN